jgi:hypothetical protein
MQRVVALLANRLHIAPARIWLLERVTFAAPVHCRPNAEPENAHLVASAGLRSAADFLTGLALMASIVAFPGSG